MRRGPGVRGRGAHGAGGGVGLADEHLDEGGLARAVGPEDRHPAPQRQRAAAVDQLRLRGSYGTGGGERGHRGCGHPWATDGPMWNVYNRIGTQDGNNEIRFTG